MIDSPDLVVAGPAPGFTRAIAYNVRSPGAADGYTPTRSPCRCSACIDSSKIELMAYRCLIKNRTENLMRRSQIEEEVEFGVAPRIVDAYR